MYHRSICKHLIDDQKSHENIQERQSYFFVILFIRLIRKDFRAKEKLCLKIFHLSRCYCLKIIP